MIFTEYLNKLALTSPTALNLSFLKQLAVQHTKAFTFNNLAVIMNTPLPLDTASLLNKIAKRGAGGYCFEHNKLAREFLLSIGYSTTIKLARVLNNRDQETPRTHRITLVECDDNTYLFDVGFGANCPNAPVPLYSSTPTLSGHQKFWIERTANNEFTLVKEDTDGPFMLYRFDLADYTDADCELGHFYSHKHPNAVFVNNLVLSRNTDCGVVSITNQHFYQRLASGMECTLISTATMLHQLLLDEFGLNPSREISQYIFEQHIAPRLALTTNEPLYKKSGG